MEKWRLIPKMLAGQKTEHLKGYYLAEVDWAAGFSVYIEVSH